MRTISPCHDFILVEQLEQGERKTRGGVIMPDIQIRREPKAGENQKRLLCKVVAIGPGGVTEHGNLIPMCCKVGDIVVVTGDAELVWLDQDRYLQIRNLQVSGIVTGEVDEVEDAVTQQPVVLQ